MELKGKTAVVTGANRGIGKGIAKVLADKGANVVVMGRNREALEQVAQEIIAANGNAMAVVADVTQKNSLDAMVEATLKKFGSLDILVNNAGVESPAALLQDVTEEQWDKVLNTNLKGVFLCCQAVLPPMFNQNKGRIINIGSVASLRMTFLGSVNYSASKHGLIGLTKHLAWELADHNITVNTVCPGGVSTAMTESTTSAEFRDKVRKRLIPLGRSSSCDEIGEAVSFFAGESAAMITGQAIAVDGGILTGYGEDLRAVVRARMASLKAAGAQ